MSVSTRIYTRESVASLAEDIRKKMFVACNRSDSIFVHEILSKFRIR